MKNTASVKELIAIVAILCVITGALSGCGGGSPSGNGSTQNPSTNVTEQTPESTPELPEPVTQAQAIKVLDSYTMVEIISHDTDWDNLVDEFTFIGQNEYNYMTLETTGIIVFQYNEGAKEWRRRSEDDSILSRNEIWDVSGKWEYRYTYSIEGDPRTIIEFDLEIYSFDRGMADGSYAYKIQDKPLMRSWKYSTDEENECFYAESGYQYIGNLNASNYGRVYDYYAELYDDTLEDSLTQPCFIIDKDEGVLILTGHEQWSPLRSVTRVSHFDDNDIKVSEVPTDDPNIVSAVTTGTAIIEYDANGGIGAPNSHNTAKDSDGVAIFNLSTTEPTKRGYTFLGWRLFNDTVYDIDSPGQNIAIGLAVGEDETLTYYAQWKEK